MWGLCRSLHTTQNTKYVYFSKCWNIISPFLAEVAGKCLQWPVSSWQIYVFQEILSPVSVEPCNIKLIPLCLFMWDQQFLRGLSLPFLLWLLYSIWILGWDNKFTQFSLQQLRIPRSKQTQTKVTLFNDLLFCSDSISVAAITPIGALQCSGL